MKTYIEYDPRYSDPVLLYQASALGRVPDKTLEMSAEEFVRKYVIPAFMPDHSALPEKE